MQAIATEANPECPALATQGPLLATFVSYDPDYQTMRFEMPLPEDLREFLDRLRREAKAKGEKVVVVAGKRLAKRPRDSRRN